MDARSYEALADLLADSYTVLTTDPRGINRSPVDDPNTDSTPQRRADDMFRLFKHLDAGPAVILGSSGGAVTGLALLEEHPEQVSTVIAHEPPLIELLDDRDKLRTGTEEMIAIYSTGDVIGAWAKFMAQANFDLPEGALEHMFGGDRDPKYVADELRWFTHELRETVCWQPNLTTLQGFGTRIMVGIGEESSGQLAERTSLALAKALGLTPTIFPGGHTGFADNPVAFAPRLREILEQISILTE
jgi:pimeloyl-ACP methyl ester carboxylesterase